MKNLSRTPIFEPLFSQEEQLLTPPSTHLAHSSSSDWLSSTYSASPSTNQLRKSPATIFSHTTSTHQTNIHRSSANDPATRTHSNCGPIHPHHHGNLSSSSMTDPALADASMPSAPPSRSFSLSHVVQHVEDDGSVATKLLASITKSISSPSLLSCCKESVRETSYQKTLRLRRMKLQHCAEELGSESSDCTSTYSDGGNNSCFDSLSPLASSQPAATISSFARPSSSPTDQSECDASPMMITVRSAPNLRCSSLHTTHVRERSFPPPLTHTLPRSASSDSFAFSLRACREDGRLMLKEVKVPCRQYLQANRKDGRLTLQLFTADDDVEQEDYTHKESADVTADLRREETVVDTAAPNDTLHKGEVKGCSYGDKLEVESAGGVAVGGDFKMIGEKESVHVNMDAIVRNTVKLATSADARKDGLIGANGLLTARSNDDCDDKAETISGFGPLCTRRADFNGEPHNQPSIVCLRILSSPWKLNTLSPGNIPKLKASPVTRFSQCEENLVLQSRLCRKAQVKGVKAMLGLEIVSASLQGAGFSNGDGDVLSPTVVFKDVGAKSLMENVTKLVSSFELEGGKWCQRNTMARRLEGSGFKGSELKESSMYDGIRSMHMGVRKPKKNGAVKAGGVRVDSEGEPRFIDAFGEVEGSSGGIDEEGVTTKPKSLHLDVQMPLQLDWVHNLHCKELFGRNNLGSKGLSWVAIRT